MSKTFLVFLLIVHFKLVFAGISQEEITAVNFAQKSKNIKALILKRDSSEKQWVILLGHENYIEAEDALILGKIIKASIAKSGSNVTAECKKLAFGLPYIKTHVEGLEEISDLEDPYFLALSPRALKGTYSFLGKVIKVSTCLNTALFVRSLALVDTTNEMAGDNANKILSGCTTPYDITLAYTGCVLENQAALKYTILTGIYASTIGASALLVQYFLQKLYPKAKTSISVDIGDAIVKLFKENTESKKIISLVNIDDFDAIVDYLKFLEFHPNIESETQPAG